MRDTAEKSSDSRAAHRRYSASPAMSETVQSYIDKHSLQTKVEDALNACVKSRPDEPLTFMVIETD